MTSIIRKCKACGREFRCKKGSQADNQRLCGLCYWKEGLEVFNIGWQHRKRITDAVVKYGVSIARSHEVEQQRQNLEGIQFRLRKWRLPWESVDYGIKRDVFDVSQRSYTPEMPIPHIQKPKYLRLRSQLFYGVADDRTLFSSKDMLIEGYCEECSNYGILCYNDGLYLCPTCKYLKG